jgi:hypothetical protein
MNQSLALNLAAIILADNTAVKKHPFAIARQILVPPVNAQDCGDNRTTGS